MDIFHQQKDLTAASQEIDGLQKYVARLMAEKDVLVEDLKGYETDGYEQFKKVLAKEKIRIAMVRMTVAANEEYLHERLQGQFNEVEMLMRNKENIERDISVATRKISDANIKTEKLKSQLKKQLQNQIERK